MNPWDNISYQKIIKAEFKDGLVKVCFDDNSIIILEPGILYSQEENLLWDELHFNTFELVIPVFNGEEIFIPWDKIRVITDEKFSSFLASESERESLDIGVKIKRLRISRDIKSKDLAIRSGLTPQTISRIEKGKQDINFKTLRKILAVLGYNLKDLAELSIQENTKTFDVLIQKLGKAGIRRSLIIDRLLPEKVLEDLRYIRDSNPSLLLDEIALYISKVFKWDVETIWSNESLTIDSEITDMALYKKPSNATENDILKAYSQYAHYIASIIIDGTPSVEKNDYPSSTEEAIEQFFSFFDEVSFSNVLDYCWDLGIRVVPLVDSGTFHGASWNIEGTHVIILKQNSLSSARWTFDLLHELYHVLAHLSTPNSGVLELEEIKMSNYSDLREQEADTFAKKFIFGGEEESLITKSVDQAGGKVENLKNAVKKVAKEENIALDFLANLLAFRLQNQDVNWWGTAHNLQRYDIDPYLLCKQKLETYIDFSRISKIDKDLITRALTKI